MSFLDSTSFSTFFTFSLSLNVCRFGANSPGDGPGKFARPRSAQPELHQQLVSGQRAGEHAGERPVQRRTSETTDPCAATQLLSLFLFQADKQNPALSEKAQLHLEKYNFPVEMLVALPNGTIVNIESTDLVSMLLFY